MLYTVNFSTNNCRLSEFLHCNICLWKETIVELLSNVMVCWGFLILYILKIKLGTYTSLIGVKLGEDQRTLINMIKVYKISDVL